MSRCLQCEREGYDDPQCLMVDKGDTMSDGITEAFRSLGEREAQRRIKEQKWRDALVIFKQFYGDRWKIEMIQHILEDVEHASHNARNNSNDS